MIFKNTQANDRKGFCSETIGLVELKQQQKHNASPLEEG